MFSGAQVVITALCMSYVFFLYPKNAYAMHIMEGFLPIQWCGFWFALSIPFLFAGMRSIQKTVH